jgi:hypothetical protein
MELRPVQQDRFDAVDASCSFKRAGPSSTTTTTLSGIRQS